MDPLQQAPYLFCGGLTRLGISQDLHRFIDYFLLQPFIITDSFRRAERAAKSAGIALRDEVHQGSVSRLILLEFVGSEHHLGRKSIAESNTLMGP